MDAKVNEALDEVAASWRGGEDEWALVMAVYRKVGGVHWVDKLERWAMESPDVEKIDVSRAEFHGWRSFRPLPGPGWPSFSVSGRLSALGASTSARTRSATSSPKAARFYGRYRRHGDEARAAKRSVLTERGLFGRLSTGVYSNADIVANYEGHRFYHGLLHDGVVAGKPALFRWEDGKPVRQRRFTWADHVNPFWDELLKPQRLRAGVGARRQEAKCCGSATISVAARPATVCRMPRRCSSATATLALWTPATCGRRPF